jgi:hypothetical protein
LCVLSLSAGFTTLTDAISGNGALSVLSLKGNWLYARGCKALAEGLKGNQVITELNIADSNLTSGGTDMSGIVALADVIPDMGAMTSLDLASNCLCGIDRFGDGVYDASGTVCSVSCLV